jgi:hypothetical protein
MNSLQGIAIGVILLVSLSLLAARTLLDGKHRSKTVSSGAKNSPKGSSQQQQHLFSSGCSVI